MIQIEMSKDGTMVVVKVNGHREMVPGDSAIRLARVLKRMGQQAKAEYQQSRRAHMDADEARAKLR